MINKHVTFQRLFYGLYSRGLKCKYVNHKWYFCRLTFQNEKKLSERKSFYVVLILSLFSEKVVVIFIDTRRTLGFIESSNGVCSFQFFSSFFPVFSVLSFCYIPIVFFIWALKPFRLLKMLKIKNPNYQANVAFSSLSEGRRSSPKTRRLTCYFLRFKNAFIKMFVFYPFRVYYVFRT